MTRVLVNILLFVPVVIVFSYDSGQRCITPNGEIAICKPIYSCDHILQSILSLDNTSIEFATQSQCENDNETLVCCGNAKLLNLDTNFPDINLLPSRKLCGLENSNNRVYGGQLTELEEFPWMVLLGYKHEFTDEVEFKCGGTIINNRYILTAAHCIRPKPGSGISLHLVRLGEWNISSVDDCYTDTLFRECADPVIDVLIEKQIAHPKYSSRTGENDIGLLRLVDNVKYSEYIQPICLPFNKGQKRQMDHLLVISGWGATGKGTSSNVKLKLEVPIVPNDECETTLSRRGKVTLNQMCAGGVEGKDTCRGDSGGPLMRDWEVKNSSYRQWYQEGITSWGAGCGRQGVPGIYTRVSNYLIWIIDNIISKGGQQSNRFKKCLDMWIKNQEFDFWEIMVLQRN